MANGRVEVALVADERVTTNGHIAVADAAKRRIGTQRKSSDGRVVTPDLSEPSHRDYSDSDWIASGLLPSLKLYHFRDSSLR
jgi:hypothetical protein